MQIKGGLDFEMECNIAILLYSPFKVKLEVTDSS